MFIKKLDRYLLRYFFTTLLVVALAAGFTIIIIHMVEQLRYFIDNSVPTILIFEYFLYFGGWVVKSFFPVFVLLSVLFSFSFLARKNEILAMKASGVSLYRIAWPVLFVSLLLSAGHFYYNEYIYPPANKKRLEIKEFDIKKRSKRSYVQVANVYRQIRPGYFYTIALFNVERSQGSDVKIYHTEKNRLVELITAKEINYIDHGWQAKEGIKRTFDDSANENFSDFMLMQLPDIKEKPEDLAKRIGNPDDMGIEELRDYIQMVKRSGGPYQRESIDLQTKYAYPLTSFIVALLSIPFAANPRKGGVAVSFAMGALIALIYFVLFQIMKSAGYNEKIPDYAAVWGVNVVFFMVGAIAIMAAKK